MIVDTVLQVHIQQMDGNVYYVQIELILNLIVKIVIHVKEVKNLLLLKTHVKIVLHLIIAQAENVYTVHLTLILWEVLLFVLFVRQDSLLL